MCNKEAEYDRAVHCNTTNYGPLRGNSADYEDVGLWWEKEVMDLVGAWEATSASEE